MSCIQLLTYKENSLILDNMKKLEQTYLEKISTILKKEENVIFAYLYGSFLKTENYHDIDIGVYIGNTKEIDILDRQLSLATKLQKVVKGKEIDLRILNVAPLSFCFNVIHEGKLIYSRDEERRTDFEIEILDRYFDFLPHLKEYYRDVVLNE